MDHWRPDCRSALCLSRTRNAVASVYIFYNFGHSGICSMEENLKQLAVSPEISDIIKIAIFGPESTGKTTLANQLADHYNTVWTPEFARNYLQEKFDDAGIVCQPEDMMPIAIGQTALENDMLLKAEKFLFSDTCLLVTKVYSEIY